MPFSPGEVIAGKYEVVRLLGAGGVGFVVAADHVELRQRVALKFLRPEMLANTEIVARFAREAHAAVRLKNEHVARVMDVGTMADGVPFIVMEYLEGKDLFEVVREQGPQPIKRAVDFILQACEGLADAHACGIVHRDVKPENLFLTQPSQGIEVVKVLDFGISKVALTGSVLSTHVPLVQTMLPMGSPVYMSPEQIRGIDGIDGRADIWATGCVLYELLTGNSAFDAPSITQLSATILEQDPVAPSALCPDIAPELEAVILRCLEKDPTQRFQNIAELALALYPFGPRRARVSAERCCVMLKVEGAAHPEFELPSVKPPSWNGIAGASGSQPLSIGQMARMTHNRMPRRTPHPRAASRVPVASQPLFPMPEPAAKSRRSLWIGAAALALAAAGGAALVSHPSLVPGRATANASSAEASAPRIEPVRGEANPAARTATEEAAEPTARREADAGTLAETPTSAGSRPAAASPQRPSPQRPAARPARGKNGVGGRGPSGASDPDPGF